MKEVKTRLIKTNRIHLVKALYAIRCSLPESGSIQQWCKTVETAFDSIRIRCYCHMSAQVPLASHASLYGEHSRFVEATYHCDLQHDISILNRDTVDPSLANSDPLFPRATHWLFYNKPQTENEKAISITQLDRLHNEFESVNLIQGKRIASDGHECLSDPELLIENLFIEWGIRHIKEGDPDLATNRRATAYPFDADLNPNARGIEADWIVIDDRGQSIFVEYFEGSVNQMAYKEKILRKQKLAAKHGITLISLYREDLIKNKIKSIIGRYVSLK